jgi:hypothetical protein
MSMKIALSLCLLSACAWAQVSITGSLSGVIHDNQSARVPNTALTLANAESGQSHKTISNGAGQYVFSNLVPGTYRLTAEHPGFRQALKEGIVVTVAEAATADVELEVGQTTETVTVAAGSEFVQAHSSEVSALVNERRIRDLPLNGKNFQQLLLLSPGMSLLGTPNNPTIDGGRAATNSYSIDGTSANDERTPQAIANYGGAAGNTDSAPSIISTEAIREFRVITSNADATYGRGSGGQISAVTKSGTNELHGSAYEYFRNDALDARDFFNAGPFRDAEGRAKVPPFKQNLFGATTGGPIVHNRHFFFASYEGFRQTKRLQTAATAIVPDADLIGLIPGDLGKLYKTFYVDRGIVTAGQNPNLTPLSAADRATAVREGFNPALFDGNTANGEAGTLAISVAPTSNVNQDSLLFHTDHRITDRLSASVRYALNRPRQVAFPNTSIAPDLQQTLQLWQTGAAQFTYTATPSQIVELRAGVQRNRYVSGLLHPLDSRLVQIGVSPTAGLQITASGTGLTDTFVYQGSGFIDNQTIPQITLIHTLTRGRLMIRSGLDLRAIEANVANNSAIVPIYTFTGFFGANGLLGSAAGQSQAIASGASVGSLFGANGGPTSAMRGWRSLHQEYFAQADWRLRPDVTVNLGLRYSYYGVYSEVNSAMSNLYAVDSSGAVRPDVPTLQFGLASYQLGTLKQYPFYQPDRNNFQPRIGVAWDIAGRNHSILRAAFGSFTDRVYQLEFSSNITNAPFVVRGSGANIPFLLSGSVPTGTVSPDITAVDPALRDANVYRYNVAFEQRVGADTSVTAAYAGARGRGLMRQEWPNAAAGVPTALRPDPNFGVVRLLTNSGYSDYNSLQLFARHRMARGIDFTVSYTLARSTDNTSTDFALRQALINLGADPNTAGVQGGGPKFVARPLSPDEGPSDYDIHQMLTITHLVELPFGRGRRYLANTKGLAEALIGGWSLTGIAILRGGEPLNLSYGSDINDDGDATQDRPALTSGRLSDLYANGSLGRTQYLIPQSQALPLLGIPSPITDPFAGVSRNALRAPSIRYYDFSLLKQIALHERWKARLELNAFNVFNHPNFAAPSAARSSALFGRIVASRAGAPPRQIQLGLKLTF